MASSLNEDPEGSRITYVKGDLFACPKTDSLAHCISEDCRMDAGIAVLFKKKFGGVEELLNQREFWKPITWFALARAPLDLLHFNKIHV
uniref:O-acyl-ADP-ribose deacylase 1 n=1 Tax=Callithrix jacchus TaxID=9483 RepID=A0A2R8NB07_CALJA